MSTNIWSRHAEIVLVAVVMTSSPLPRTRYNLLTLVVKLDELAQQRIDGAIWLRDHVSMLLTCRDDMLQDLLAALQGKFWWLRRGEE